MPAMPGALVYSTPLEDSILYIRTSDSAEDFALDVRDEATGTRLTFALPAEHITLAADRKKQKAIIGRHGF
jgi:hypothetical protein